MPVSRREFLRQGLAAALAGALPGAVRVSAAAPRYDVCIVGSGFAGTTLARRAIAAGLRTLIVEAGDEQWTRRPPGFAHADSGELVYPVERTRVIGLGGSSNHWGGVVSRMRPSDFRLRSEFGLDLDWPIGYQDLADYYCAAEALLAVSGHAPLAAEPPRGCPYPHELRKPYAPPRVRFGERMLQFAPMTYAFRDGAPLRLVQREIPELEASPLVELRRQRQATRLVTRDRARIDHLLARRPDGSAEEIRARCFVVAAGPIETPRLLLLSRSRQFPQGLGNASGAVGRRLCEHPTYSWAAPRPPDLGEPAPGGHRCHDYDDPFRRARLGGVHLNLLVRGSGPLKWQVQPEMEPRDANRVALSDSRADPFGDPLPDVALGLSQRDRRSVERAWSLLDGYARARGIPPPGPLPPLRWRSHPSGTCPMGRAAARAVVDPDGRVFGVENLYLCGSCTFPTAGTANPTLTVVALALRLGDHLAARLGGAGRAAVARYT